MGCTAVFFNLHQALKKHQMKNRRMHDWEYLEVFEETCNGAFEGYGVKLINGKNALSGPGLKQPDNIPAGGAFIQMGGQGWSNRLSEICRTIVYDKVGEDELYERFFSDRKIPDSMCHNEREQCSSSSNKLKKKTKTKAKAKSEVISVKSKDLQSVEVKSDGVATSANKTGKEVIDADSFLDSLALD